MKAADRGRRDELGAGARALPWVKIEKPYVFDARTARKRSQDLFEGRSQLAVYTSCSNEWRKAARVARCSRDSVEGMRYILQQRDTTFVAVSRRPARRSSRSRSAWGGRSKWVSSFGSDFNRDFKVSFAPDDVAKGHVEYNYAVRAFRRRSAGESIFAKDEAGEVYHTYSVVRAGTRNTCSVPTGYST